MNFILEKDIEKAVCSYAKRKGWLVYKFTSPSRRSVPDRIFIKYGSVFFIEFKRPGGKPTEKQANEIDKLIYQRIDVYVIDDIEEGKKAVDFQTELSNGAFKRCWPEVIY